MARKAMIEKSKRKPKFACGNTTGASGVAGRARVSPQVRLLPDLFPRAGAERVHPGRAQGQLVERTATMTMTDPVADMLTRIRNACGSKHRRVDVPLSRLKLEIARVLKENSYIQDYKRCWTEERILRARSSSTRRAASR